DAGAIALVIAVHILHAIHWHRGFGHTVAAAAIDGDGGIRRHAAVRRGRSGTLRRFQVDDVAQQHPAGLELVVPGDDRLERERALAQATDHHVAAGLDAFGDSDLALT